MCLCEWQLLVFPVDDNEASLIRFAAQEAKLCTQANTVWCWGRETRRAERRGAMQQEPWKGNREEEEDMCWREVRKRGRMHALSQLTAPWRDGAAPCAQSTRASADPASVPAVKTKEGMRARVCVRVCACGCVCACACENHHSTVMLSLTWNAVASMWPCCTATMRSSPSSSGGAFCGRPATRASTFTDGSSAFMHTRTSRQGQG